MEKKGTPASPATALASRVLPGARRAHQQGALGQLGADLGVLLGVVQDVDDLLEGLLGLVLAGHVQESDAGLFLHIDLGVGLAQVAHAADAALAAHAPEQEPEQAHHDQDREDIRRQETDQVEGAVHRFGVGVLAVLSSEVLGQQAHQLIVRDAGQPDGHILDGLIGVLLAGGDERSEEYTSELQSR